MNRRAATLSRSSFLGRHHPIAAIDCCFESFSSSVETRMLMCVWCSMCSCKTWRPREIEFLLSRSFHFPPDSGLSRFPRRKKQKTSGSEPDPSGVHLREGRTRVGGRGASIGVLRLLKPPQRRHADQPFRCRQDSGGVRAGPYHERGGEVGFIFFFFFFYRSV